MTLGDMRKLIAGLPNETELEIRDENTEETYAIHEIKAMAFPDCHTENFEGKTGFWLQFTTNIELQSATYISEEREEN